MTFDDYVRSRSPLWAQVRAPGEVRVALDLAERLRLDRVYRCAVPFWLRGVDAVAMTRCSTSFTHDAGWTAVGLVWLASPGSGTEYEVGVFPTDPALVVNDVIGGRDVRVSERDGANPATLEVGYPFGPGTFYVWAFGPPDPAIIHALVAGFAAANGYPPSWPDNPLVD